MQIVLNNSSGVDGQAGAVVSPRLKGAAQEFEAQMMKELLKPLTVRDAVTSEQPGSGEDEGAAGALGAFASEALGQAISRRGGFGLADHILAELSTVRRPTAKGTAADSAEKNVIRTAE